MISTLRKAGGISLGVNETGPGDGPLLFLLHGFPDFSLAWRHQVPALTAAGYRVIAPDQRGYNRSDKPKGVADYDLDVLAADVIGLARSYGQQRFTVVGHDWGASVAWWLASNHPEHLERAVMINAPHPAIWRHAMDHDAAQKKLSSYVRLLNLPWLPEMILKANDHKALVEAISGGAEQPDAETLAAYRAAWSQPGALTAMINWYRALLKRRFTLPAPGSIKTPTLLLWGREDKFALPSLAERSIALCADGELQLLNAGHWPMWDTPRDVTALLLQFLAQHHVATA